MIYTNISQVTLMSIGFMLLFTAFHVCQSMAVKILKDDGFSNLGFVTMATLYLAYALTSLFSMAIINKVGKIKITMSLGAFAYCFWIVCFLLPSYYH